VKRLFPPLLLLGLAFLIYSPALRAGFIWDDDEYVTANPHLRDIVGLGRIWSTIGATPQYYPLTFTSFWIEKRVFGDAAWGYHLTNILLHGLAGILLWLCLDRLAIRGALLAALLFVVHPLHVESVAWVTERKNVLSAALYFAAAWAFLRAFPLAPEPAAPAPASRMRESGWYLASLLLFLASLAAKTVSATLPVVLLAIAWWRNGRVNAGLLARLTPFLILGSVAGALTGWVERTYVGATGPEFQLADSWPKEVLARLLVASRAAWFYVGKLIWPWPLLFNYPRWTPELGSIGWYVPLAGWLVAGGVAVGTALRAQRGLLTGLLVFLISLAPALGFVNVWPHRYSFVADHFCYIASVGALVPVAWMLGRSGVPWALARWGVVCALGALSFTHARNFESPEALWRQTLRHNPGSWLARTNLGGELLRKGRLEEAVVELQEATRLRAQNPHAWAHLSAAKRQLGDLPGALTAASEAIARDPGFAPAYAQLGLALEALGQPEDAERAYRAALAIQPGNAPVRLRLGLLAVERKDPAGAAQYFRSAVEISPDSFDARELYVRALVAGGELSEAAKQVEILRSMRPKSSVVEFLHGSILLRRGRPAEALGAFERALQLDPPLPEAQTGADDCRKLLGIPLTTPGL
jgi:tetratricopeptide (TPR) repeat protein